MATGRRAGVRGPRAESTIEPSSAYEMSTHESPTLWRCARCGAVAFHRQRQQVGDRLRAGALTARGRLGGHCFHLASLVILIRRFNSSGPGRRQGECQRLRKLLVGLDLLEVRQEQGLVDPALEDRDAHLHALGARPRAGASSCLSAELLWASGDSPSSSASSSRGLLIRRVTPAGTAQADCPNRAGRTGRTRSKRSRRWRRRGNLRPVSAKRPVSDDPDTFLESLMDTSLSSDRRAHTSATSTRT